MGLDDDVGSRGRSGARGGRRARRDGEGARRFPARSSRLVRHAKSAVRAARRASGRRAAHAAPHHGAAVAHGPQAAGSSQARGGRRRGRAARRAQSLARVLHGVRRGAASRRRRRGGRCRGSTPVRVWRGRPSWLLESSFLETWIEAGGSSFPIVPPRHAGTSAARVVVHRGLRDARTLETYLELIERARSHVYAVNGFPLAARAPACAPPRAPARRPRPHAARLRDADAREESRSGDRGPARGPRRRSSFTLASTPSSRRARRATSSPFATCRAGRPSSAWCQPHVHAKAMSADGLRCAVGSANMDITASYWESELLLVVEDDVLARGFEAKLDALMAGSTAVSRDDPAWQEARRRAARGCGTGRECSRHERSGCSLRELLRRRRDVNASAVPLCDNVHSARDGSASTQRLHHHATTATP